MAWLACAERALRPLMRACRRSHSGALVVAVLLTACAAGPKPLDRDGPAAKPPADLAKVPDAEPRVEPIRPGGPNKPYEVLGKDYTPLDGDKPLIERGLASWYGRKFQGRRTASGEVYNMYAMTAAHKTMPIPSYARVRNPANGREVIVRVNDRGPFHSGRIIDLSYTAALKLGLLNAVAPVEIERLTHEQIRTGSWRRDASDPASATAVASADAVKEIAPTAPAGAEPIAAPTVAVAPTATAPERAFSDAAKGYWVQLGAFRERGGAEAFQSRVSDELDWLAPLMAVFKDPGLFRLQAGPYPNRSEAQDAADRVREALKLVPLIVERR